MEVKAGYKQTEVGVIPEDWEYLYVDELKNSSENALSTGPFGSSISSKFFQKTGIPVIRGSNLSTDGATRLKEDDFVFVSEEKAFEFRRSCVFPGDLIFTCWGTINQVGLIEVNSSYSQYVISNKQMKLTPLSRIADSVFLFYLFSSSEIQQIIVNQSIGSSIPGFNLGQLRSMRLRIPPLPEQEAIAEALTDADTLIASLEQLIAKKRSLKQGAMQALLTGQQRLPGFEVKPGYQQTEVGLIPEDWDMTEIGNLISDFRGGAPLKPSDFIDSGVKVLPKGGVGRSGWLKINPLDLQFCSNDFASSHRSNQVDNSFTIVVLRDLVPSGPSIGLIVQIKENETYVLAQGVYGFKVNHLSIPGYLVQVSNTKWYRKIANSTMVGSTQVHITNTAFKKIKIPLPPTKAEQEAIATILSDMDNEISTLEAKLTKARQIKQGMMQELLTGRIRLV